MNNPSAIVMITAGIKPTSSKDPMRSFLSERFEALSHVRERLSV